MRHTDILNELDEIIYVVDQETYALLFMNKAAYGLCALEKKLLGRKCYEVLQGKDAPCNFCTQSLPHTFFHSWEYTNRKYDRHFLVRDKIIPWYNRKARLVVAIDITHQQKEREILQKKLNIESTVVECIRILDRTPDANSAMPLLMEVLARFYMADRAHITAFAPITKAGPRIHEWCAEGVPSRKEVLAELAQRYEENWKAAFVDMRSIVAETDASSLDPCSAGCVMLQKLNVGAVMAVPILWDVRKEWEGGEKEKQDGPEQPIAAVIGGSLGVDNPRYAFGDTSLLESVAYFVKNYVEKRNLKTYLEALGYKDAMTRVGNRNTFISVLRNMRKAKAGNVGVVYVDINGLKAANDAFGHVYGDQIIIKVAKILKSIFEDEVYRTGGDEFVVLCRDISQAQFQTQVQRMKQIFAETKDCEVSCGVSWKHVVQDINTLVRYVDELMYVEKQTYYKSRLGKRSLHHSSILEETLLSLQNEEFLVYLQPKVCLKSSQTVGAEALIRKRGEARGDLIPPDQFIPLLESEFLIRHIDFFVLHKVCELLKKWMQASVVLIPLSVNLSRITLMEHGIVEKVSEVCALYDIPHNLIDIEITESVDKMSLESLMEITDNLMSAGFTISLDDFGSKYCNMAILTKIKFNNIKLDKSIVDALRLDHRAEIVAKHSIGICKDMGNVHSVAEGIEDETQLNMLKALCCDYGQGYFFSRPLDIDSFERRYMAG